MRSDPSGWKKLWTSLGFTRNRYGHKPFGAFSGKSLRIETLEQRRLLTTVTVNYRFDEQDGIADGQISLRDAIAEAVANPSVDKVEFDAALNAETIELLFGLGHIEFGKDLIIDASMLADGITIDAGDITPMPGDGIRIFDITDPLPGTDSPLVTMKNLTLTRGDVSSEGGAIRSAARLVLDDCKFDFNEATTGGAIFVQVAEGVTPRNALTIENSLIENNRADAGGGVAVGSAFAFFTDNVAITRTIIHNNDASIVGGGGGISAHLLGGSMTLTNDSKITGNDAGDGGAIYAQLNDAQLTIDGSLISDNHAINSFGSGVGGGIWLSASNQSQVRIQRSTLSLNTSVTKGGGLRAALTQESSLVVEDSTVTGNNSGGKGGGLYAHVFDSSLVITGSTISGNTSQEDGGGVFAYAAVTTSGPAPAQRVITISKSLISGNEAANRGGGLYTNNLPGTETLIEDSRITGNKVPSGSLGSFRNGGGLYAYTRGHGDGSLKPNVIITRSTIDDNEADFEGGGIFLCSKDGGNLIMTNSTVSGNETLDLENGFGGGIFIAHPANDIATVDAILRNVTVTQNVSKFGAGVATPNLDRIQVEIANSIISENFTTAAKTTPSNLNGRVDVSKFKHNLIGTGSTVRNVSGTVVLEDAPGVNTIPGGNNNLLRNNSPMLTPLANRGGFTPTHSLSVGSPAIDAGFNDLARNPLDTNPATWNLPTDQRGTKFPRRFNVPGVRDPGDIVDIGAYEVGLAKVIDVIISNSSSAHPHAPYRFSEAFAQGIHELRTVPVGGADTIEVVFSEWVNVDAADLFMIGHHTTTVYTTAWNIVDFLPCDPVTFTARWRFDDADADSLPDALPADKLRFTLNASTARAVFDAYGNRLDGEFVPPANLSAPSPPSLTSGNDVASGQFLFWFNILPGDLDLDNDVDGSDWLDWQELPKGGTDKTFTDGDFDGDGDVDNDDFAMLLANFGKQFY